jgi:hypothetical protein
MIIFIQNSYYLRLLLDLIEAALEDLLAVY